MKGINNDEINLGIKSRIVPNDHWNNWLYRN